MVAKHDSLPDSAQRLHEALLLLQRHIRRIRQSIPFDLGAQETIALMLIATRPGLIARELTPLLSIHQSNVSRLLAYLKDSGFINLLPSPADKRALTVSFTTSGKDLLRRLESHASEVSNEAFRALTKSQCEELGRLLNEVADALDAPPERSRPREHSTEAPRRRLTIRMSLVGREYMGSAGCDVAEYQLLFDLFRRSAPVRFRSLVLALPFEATKLSRALSELAERNIVIALEDANDKRGTRYALSSNGRRVFEKLHSKVTESFEAVDSRISRPDQARLLELIQTALSAEPSRYEMVKCESESEIREARAFLVEELVNQRRHRTLPERLLSREQVCLVACEGEVIRGLIVRDRSGKVIDWFVVPPGSAATEVAEALWMAVSSEVAPLKTLDPNHIVLPESVLTEPWASGLERATRIKE